MLPFLTIEKFADESGYSPDAVRSKIKRGDWLEGREWKKAPDGRILISVEGYTSWVEQQQPAASAKPQPARSKSTSSTAGSAAGSG